MSEAIKDKVWDTLIAVIAEILEDLGEEPGDLTRETMLVGDLGLSSVEAIHIAIMLENKLRVALDFERLAVRDGEYVDDLSVGAMQDFVVETIANHVQRA
ncbi:acyl carrier protein [Sphingomonas sp. 37zxx]|uniref:acyl carrier protein n=1 Tax=Sphingomonas sp. 37zxx TaxID=1550073 RepID=UPI00053BFB1C|nr:acyl carrier protein [Sphingomonas sp. 37zxx]